MTHAHLTPSCRHSLSPTLATTTFRHFLPLLLPPLYRRLILLHFQISRCTRAPLQVQRHIAATSPPLLLSNSTPHSYRYSCSDLSSPLRHHLVLHDYYVLSCSDPVRFFPIAPGFQQSSQFRMMDRKARLISRQVHTIEHIGSLLYSLLVFLQRVKL